MEELSFFTAFRPALTGAFMVIVQFVLMAIFKEGSKRNVDTSWYDAKTRGKNA